MDQHFVPGRRQRQKFPVIRDSGQLPALYAIKSVGERHFTVGVMMAICFAVGRNVHQLRAGAIIGEAAEQAVCEFFAVVEQFFKGDSLRHRAVVEEQVN